MTDNNSLGGWIQGKCNEEGLSLRQMATKVGVSHQTIAGLMTGKKALPQTIKKLAKAFGNDHHHQTIALEDKLLVLAGYRTERPEEELNEARAKIMDIAQNFNEPELDMLYKFAVFLAKAKVK